MLYFAYGSNMLVSRLSERISDFKLIGNGYICDFDITFNKLGTDCSGKANIVKSFGKKVYGRIFDLPKHEFSILDCYEGAGVHYERQCKEIFVCSNVKTKIYAQVYVAMPEYIFEDLHPTKEYKNFVFKGAKEAEFPNSYTFKLGRIITQGV